ncbi:uncharacterized protein FFB14_15257 [Fusarium fujikuroi]|nr:uncharacterized protein FFB14_15257 [Fusarium fujikuroi]
MKPNGSREFVVNSALALSVKNCFGNRILGDVSSSRVVAAVGMYEAGSPIRRRVRERDLGSPPLEALTLGPQLGHPGQQVLNGLWATVLMAFDSSNSSTDRRDLQSLAELLRLRNQIHSEHSEAEETDSNVTDNTCIEILLNMTYYIDSSGCVTPKEEDIDTQFRLTFAPNRFQYLPQSDFRARRSEHAIVLSTELSL